MPVTFEVARDQVVVGIVAAVPVLRALALVALELALAIVVAVLLDSTSVVLHHYATVDCSRPCRPPWGYFGGSIGTPSLCARLGYIPDIVVCDIRWNGAPRCGTTSSTPPFFVGP